MGTTDDLKRQIAETQAGGVCRVDPALGPYRLDVPLREILPTDRSLTVDFQGVTVFTSGDWLANRRDEHGTDALPPPGIVIRHGTFIGQGPDASADRPLVVSSLALSDVPPSFGNRFVQK